MSGVELFILIIFLIPVYGLLIWAYKNPEESYLFGRRWMYDKEPEFCEEAIYILKRVSMITIVVFTFVVVLTIYRSF